MRTSKVPFRVGWFCICCTSLSLSANSAMAAFSGNPVGGPDATPGVAMDSNGVGWWKSTLNPSPALQMSTCPWVLSGLSAQGFDADGADNMPGGGDDWTVTTATALTGSVKINEYYAWVTQ